MNCKTLLVFVCFILAASIANGATIPDLKAKDVVHWGFGTFLKPDNKSVEFGIEFYSPTKPGRYPVLVFQGGFDGLVPSFVYSDFLAELTLESNKIVVFLNKIKFIHLPEKEEMLLEITLNWTLANLNGLFNDKKTPEIIKGKVFPDLKTIGPTLMSHSSAAHPVVAYMNKTCGLFKSLILLDPVDGYDPFGIVNDFITHPPKQLPFTIPTLIIANGYDNVPVNSLFPACASTNTSNKRFYYSLPGPTILLNFTTYGHADILDDAMRRLTRFICKTCETDCNFDLYRKNHVQALVLFMTAVDQRDRASLQALENPTDPAYFDPSISITSIQKYNGYDIIKTGPFCEYSSN